MSDFESVVTQIMLTTNCDRAKAVAAALLNGYTPSTPAADVARREDVLEKEEQAEVTKVFRGFRFKVRNLSQARRTKQAPGLADLWCMHEDLPIAFWWETKRQVGGKLSEAQLEFRQDCIRCGVGYGTGDRHAARTHLINLGLACVVAGALEPIHVRKTA